MFGFLKNKENRNEQVNQRYKEIATVIVKTLKRDPKMLALPNIAEKMARDSLRNLTETQILESSILAMAFWSMACTANTAFKDKDFEAATAFAKACLPLASSLMKINPNEYSEIEFSIINTGMNFMKEAMGAAGYTESSTKQLSSEQNQLKERMQDVLRKEHVLRDEMKLTTLFDYSKKGVGLEILQHYGASLFMAGVSGKLPLNASRSELDELCTQMAVAAIFDDPTGIAFSCFCQQTNSFALFLPVPPSHMNPEARAILLSLIEDKPVAELSPSGKKYLAKYQGELVEALESWRAQEGEPKRLPISLITPQQQKSRLVELAPRVSQSGLMFDEMNGDLGAAAKAINDDSKEMWMAYAYARRTSAAALYIQGYFSKEEWEYVDSIWRSIGLETDPGEEFQERAFAEAVSFMQTYHHICTSLFAKNLVEIAKNCTIPPQNMSDEELIRFVLDFMYEKQQSRRNAAPTQR